MTWTQTPPGSSIQGSHRGTHRLGHYQLRIPHIEEQTQRFPNSQFIMIQETFPMIIGEQEMKTNANSSPVEGTDRSMQGRKSVRYLILHCSATRCDKDYTAEQLLCDHKTRGLPDCRLPLDIRRDGTITQHRKLLKWVHRRSWNRCSIGIRHEGGLDAHGHPADTRTAEQTEQLTLLLMRLAKLFPGARIRDIGI